MIDLGRGAIAMLVVLVLGVAACEVATPPSASPAVSMTSEATVPTTSVRQSDEPATPRPERSIRPSANRLELEIGTIDPALLWPMLEFASDSYGIIWSSGVLDGPAAHTAPDLWRYVPGTDEPVLLWQNPDRDRQLAKIAGDTDLWAFSEISSEGERWWKLWVMAEADGVARLIDAQPGVPNVPDLVPSFDVDAGRVAWTSFHPGATAGSAVSQLWIAEAPTWEARLLAEHDAAERALWLPSLLGSRLAYVDVEIADDPAEDIRHVMLLDLADPEGAARQLDTSGNATMPVVSDGSVTWKEPDVGFAMFNWGRLMRYAFDTETVTGVHMMPQEYLNYPSGGGRWIAAWGADSSTFTVHDLERGVTRSIGHFDPETESIARPHVAGDLLVWMRRQEVGTGTAPPAPLEYAWLPGPGTDRRTEP